MADETVTPLLSGVAGEYYVAAELSARNCIASITLRNTKGVDILCSNQDASKNVGLQVKTNRGNKREWMLNIKAEEYFADHLYYVFVNLNNRRRPPDYFIVPSKYVATHVKETHLAWLNTPGRGGKAHVDSTMRKFRDHDEKFLSKWNILNLW